MASALDMNLEELARQAELERQAQRYVPASGAVPPMVPTQGGPYGPVQGPPEPTPAQQPQVPTGIVTRALGALSGTPIPATTTASSVPVEIPSGATTVTTLPGAVQRGLSVVGGMPIVQPPVNPPEQPSPRPLPPGSGNVVLDERPSGATQAIVDARNTGAEPAVEGQESTVQRLVRGALTAGGRAEQALTEPDEPARPYRGSPAGIVTPEVTRSDAPTAGPEPVPDKVDLKKPIKPKGTAGGAQPALAGARPRDALPDATDKAMISPTFLVQLEKSNPALHDGIVQAATAAGIGSWDYANMVYAMSKGDPNHVEDGRIGLAGLTQQDIERYQKQHPELFRDAQGNPTDPRNPSTNLLVGALKYRETRDQYGAKTPASVLGYIMGPDKIDPLSRLTEPEQRGMIPPQVQQKVQEAVHGPDAGAPYMKPVPVTVPASGTATASQTMATAVQAARSGNALPFIGYMANVAPRGMDGNDAWRYIENNVTAAFLRSGNVEGAQRARELVFQMSHVGANQALMSAYKQMQLGDYHGSAQQLALAYWAAPDGGLAQFAVGQNKDGSPVMMGQRYNADTRKPVGPTFEVTPDKIMTMMQQTRDPATFAKIMQDNQKMHAEIANKEADTALKGAHAKYYGDLLPSLERRATESVEERAGAAAARATMPPKGNVDKLDPRVAAAQAVVHPFFKTIDPVTQREQVPSPEEAIQMDLATNLKLHNDSLTGGMAVNIAKDLQQNPTGGKYMVLPNKAKPGWGAVFDRATRAPVGELDPSAARQLRVPQAAAPAKAAPGLGGGR